MLQDYLFFGVDKNFNYSYRMLHLSKLVEEAKNRHGLNHPRALLLADAFLGCILLSSLLDYDERINLRIHCGEHFTVGVETDFQAHTRGYIECNESSEIVQQIDAGQKVETGFIVRSLRSQRNKSGLFEGISSSFTNNIQDALNEHLTCSYQMNTRLKMNSWIDPTTQTLRSFGVVYQELPDILPEVSERLGAYVMSLPSMKELYLFNSDPDILAQKLIPDETKAVKSLSPEFVCQCTAEKVEDAVSAYPLTDLEDMIAQGKDVEVRCHYCNTHHAVTVGRIGAIYSRLSKMKSLN